LGANSGWLAGGPATVLGASWSPDGGHLLVWSQADASGLHSVQLLDADGELVRSFDAITVAWLDPDSYLVGQTDSSSVAHVSSGTVDSAGGSLGSVWLASGDGAVAYLDSPNPSIFDEPGPADHFAVWSRGGIVAGAPGRPVAWSPDGSKLVVWHYQRRTGSVGGQPFGTIAVLAWPGLRQLAGWPDVTAGVAPVRFDPTSRYLEIPTDGYSIADLTIGAFTARDVATGSAPVWNASSDLVMPSLDGKVTTYALDGRSLGSRQAGDSVAGSTNGRTIVYFWWESSRPLIVSTAGSARTLSAPGRLADYPEISADGAHVAILCNMASGARAFLLRTP